MKVIYHINGDPNSGKNTKHVVKFFGIFGCIKVNALGKDISKKQGDKFNVVEYYFDYPYFSRIVNPGHFQKELKDGEKKITRTIVSLWACAAMLSAISYVLLYLAHSNQKSKKVIAGLVTASVILSTIACTLFFSGLLWLFFDFVKEKLVVYKIKSLLESELSSEWITLFKDALIEKQSKKKEANNPEIEKSKDIEEIIQFFLERKKIPALFKFLINGEKLVQAGMAMVNQRLLDNVSPNDIVLDTNSMGGGIATEVLRRFEDQGIYLTLIHSNSYSSLKDVANTFTKWLAVKCLNILHKFFKLELNSEKVIDKTKCPVLIVGREGDPVIIEPAQLVGKLNDSAPPENPPRINVTLQHDPNQECNIANIHTDHEEHLVWKDGEEYESYIKVKSDFIELTHDYLTSYKVNEKFDSEQYRESAFSKSFTEIKLVHISNETGSPMLYTG